MELEQQLENFLSESVSEAFQTMLSLEMQTDKGVLEDGKFELICSIGFKGTLEGTISLALTQTSGANIVAKMLSMEPEELALGDISDGIQEMVNIIAGGVKTRLTGTEHSFDISIPSVVQGSNVQLLGTKDMSRVENTFSNSHCSFGTVIVFKISDEVMLNKGKASSSFSKEDHFAQLQQMIDDSQKG